MTRILLTAIAAFLSATGAFAQDKDSQKFLTEAIQGNYAESKMGDLAQSNGQSPEVKSYGQMLITDHNAANQKAMDAAKSLGVTPPTEPNAKQKSDYAKMAKMKGAAFDKMFAQHMVLDHRKDIKAYEKAAKKQDAAGQYAQGTLATLKTHLENAQALQTQKSSRR